jgi:hypothetical protein
MDYAAAVERDATALFELCERDLDREIPACPGWRAANLRLHIIETFAGEVDGFGEPTDDHPLERVLAALAAARTEAKAVAHECAVHRWDVADAWRLPFEIDSELACEGIEGFFLSAWPLWLEYFKKPAGSGQRLGLHATDSGTRWVVTLDERPVVEHTTGPYDVEVTGSASDLFLWLWGRFDPPHVEGDRTVLEMMRNPQGRYLSPGF